MEEWDKQTVIRKGPMSRKDARSTVNVNKAMADGTAVIQKKDFHQANKAVNAPSGSDLARIDRAEEVKVVTVSQEVSKAIMQGRQQLGLTQKELAAKICEKPTIVQEYESCKAIPSHLILSKLSKALGVKLQGTNIGSKL